MTKATLQEVFNLHLEAYTKTHSLPARQWEVCSHIQQCRTEAMGGMHLQCNHCGNEQDLYYSCRDRHCPMCQQQASQQWSEQQLSQVLPITYFHLVFTLPNALNGWMRLHPKEIYRLLFQAVWSTLKRFGQDPSRLGGEMGMTAILHTWGQNLSQHVHLHCLVPGGALTKDGAWRAAKSTYLFPVRALSRCFRGNMVSKLRKCIEKGELCRVTAPKEPKCTLDQLMESEWVVYSRYCLYHTDSIVEYLARYSHRSAISNHRIRTVDGTGVTFSYKDYADDNQYKMLRLSADEFIRRVLQHILPKGFMRIRSYGFLANCCRKKKRPHLLRALKQKHEEEKKDEEAEPAIEECGYPCPRCHKGRLRVIMELAPVHGGYG